MPVKIFMCPCYKDYFKEKGRSYIKHLIDFHCKCKEDDHEIFVHFCSSHPWVSTILSIPDSNGDFQRKCFCRSQHANEICQHCIAVRYSLNFQCHKICIDKPGPFKNNSLSDYLKKEVPEALKINDLGEYLRTMRVTPLNDYLKELDSDPFFYFENNRVEISWDNPAEKVPKKTDSRPIFFRS